MSTGDQTTYVRAKLAERNPTMRVHKPATFMKDGFDRWAESTEPMRVGQMEKIAAEETKMSSGGAMSIQDVIRYGKQAHQFGKTHGKTMKALARAYGGEYGSKAADVAEMLGYGGGAVDYFNPRSSRGALDGMGDGAMGTRKGQVRKTARRAYEGMSGGVKLYDVIEGVSKGHAKAKEYAPRVKRTARMAGVPQVAEAIEYLGYGGNGINPATMAMAPVIASKAVKYAAPHIKKYAKSKGQDAVVRGIEMLGYGDGGVRRRKTKGGVLPLAAPALIAAAPYLASAATGIAAGIYGERGVQSLKKKIARNYVQEHNIGRGAGGAKRKPSARNEIVRQVMRERGVSLPEASSIVKREGLY